MRNIFKDTSLEQPRDHDFLWKFIKPKHIDSFLAGELYFSQLIEFDDYYEAITPLHHLIISFSSRTHDLKIPQENETLLDFSNLISKTHASLEINQLLNQLKCITKINNGDDLFKIFKEAAENIEYIHHPYN